MNKKTNLSDIKKKFKEVFRRVYAYRGFIFFLVVSGIYGYIVWRINVLSSAPPSQADLTSAEQSVPRPKISESAIRKLNSLEDNSVRVQTLFNEARQNPFQE